MLKNTNYILFFLLAINCYAQKELIDKLKIIELNFATSTFDTIISQNKSSLYQSISLELDTKIDTVKQFISNQKRDSEITFESTIQPFLLEQLAEINSQSIDFNEQEELIFESFAKDINWNTTLQRLLVYENFIDANYKDSSQIKNLIYVLNVIHYMHFYANETQENKVEKTLICLKENFEYYNAVNWKVFALNPTAMILWTIATCIWDITTLQNNSTKLKISSN